jgi:hypothetical protein
VTIDSPWPGSRSQQHGHFHVTRFSQYVHADISLMALERQVDYRIADAQIADTHCCHELGQQGAIDSDARLIRTERKPETRL